MRSWKIFNRSATGSSGDGADSATSGDGADANATSNPNTSTSIRPSAMSSLRSFATGVGGGGVGIGGGTGTGSSSDPNLTVDTGSTGGTSRYVVQSAVPKQPADYGWNCLSCLLEWLLSAF
jgi:hypothetical protein